MIYFSSLQEIHMHKWYTIKLGWAKENNESAKREVAQMETAFYENLTKPVDRKLIRECLRLSKEYLQHTVDYGKIVKGEYETHLRKARHTKAKSR